MCGQLLAGSSPGSVSKRTELISHLEHCRSISQEKLRRQIIDQNRIDILATGILGYEVKPFHLSMLKFQFEHPENLQLVFRGSGKTTLCTIVKTIHFLCKNRDLRILIASKTIGNAESFLKEIKDHLEGNAKLIELFGPFYDEKLSLKWDSREIEVLGRTRRTKESSVTCVGVDSTIVSKHYDIFILDDLVDEDNSRTKHMRDRTQVFYYQTLDPCLEPPSEAVPHRGERHVHGTHYHFDDLYAWLRRKEMQDHCNVIRALDDSGNSPWPEKFPPQWFLKKREKSGVIIFNSQYQNNTEAMKGKIFKYDDCQIIEDSEIPSNLRIYMGVDLAIAEKDSGDKFAIVVIGLDLNENVFVLDFLEGHFRFGEQTKHIIRIYDQYDPIRCNIESNGYQKAQYHNLKDFERETNRGLIKRIRKKDSSLLEKVKTRRVYPKPQDKDKIARAWKLNSIFEEKRVFFRKILSKLIEILVLFPNCPYKDGFDAFDLAYAASKKGKSSRRERRVLPKLF